MRKGRGHWDEREGVGLGRGRRRGQVCRPYIDFARACLPGRWRRSAAVSLREICKREERRGVRNSVPCAAGGEGEAPAASPAGKKRIPLHFLFDFGLIKAHLGAGFISLFIFILFFCLFCFGKVLR